MRARVFFPLLFVALLAAHLCHSRVLWTEEALPLAAAQQMLLGKLLYRDIWFDKPPLVPLVYLLIGAKTGVVLRLFGAVYGFLCCAIAWRFASKLWGPREGLWAAILTGFFLTFDTPSATLPLAADLLLMLPHFAAIYLAWSARPFASGICAGVAFLFNVKAAFVLLACLFFAGPAVLLLAGGFVSVVLPASALLLFTGAWPAYVDQVWIWPSLYAGSSHVANPVANGILRTLNWSGFHAALLIAGIVTFLRASLPGRWKWLIWIGLCLSGVALGARFFPRYYFQLVPPFVILAGRGLVLLSSRARMATLALLLIPLFRFGPRYPILAMNLQPQWADLALDADSRDASLEIRRLASPVSTLYVWGYRPDIFVYTRLRAASRYLDCQAMTGVPADRHLGQSQPVRQGATANARLELARSQPDFIADGLSLFNPALSMDRYPELHRWLSHYREFARTRGTVLYQRVIR